MNPPVYVYQTRRRDSHGVETPFYDYEADLRRLPLSDSIVRSLFAFVKYLSSPIMVLLSRFYEKGIGGILGWPQDVETPVTPFPCEGRAGREGGRGVRKVQQPTCGHPGQKRC